jgi:predicted RNA-binding Zn-ribbon protein involved in translation (DUF1610 family)
MSSQQQITKLCPYCAEEILVDAKKCKHCGEVLNTKMIPNLGGLKPRTFGTVVTKIICPNCGYEGKPKTKVEGAMFVEFLLLLFFIIPGLIYSAWRSSTKHYVCPKCGCKEINKA